MQSLEAWRFKLQDAADELASHAGTKIIILEVISELSEPEKQRLSSDQLVQFSKITTIDRKREWSESRRCEWELGSFALKTLSHTKREEKHFVFAWGADLSAIGIGIDVELRSRAISEASSLRFIEAAEWKGEGVRDLSPLQVWTIKEAVFKANPANSNTLIPQYRVSSYDAERKCGVCLDPEKREYAFTTLELDSWVVTLARCLSRQAS